MKNGEVALTMGGAFDFYQAFFECFEAIFYKLSYVIDNSYIYIFWQNCLNGCRLTDPKENCPAVVAPLDNCRGKLPPSP